MFRPGSLARFVCGAVDHIVMSTITVGVQRPVGPIHEVPPPGLSGNELQFRHEPVAGERVADELRAGLVLIRMPYGLIGRGESIQPTPQSSRKRLPAPGWTQVFDHA